MSKLILVQHTINDKEKFGAAMAEMSGQVKGKTLDEMEAWANLAFQGNVCVMCSVGEGMDNAACFWRTDKTLEEFQAFIDAAFPMCTNISHEIPEDQAAGISHLTARTYLADWSDIVEKGAARGFVEGGDLYLAHHYAPTDAESTAAEFTANLLKAKAKAKTSQDAHPAMGITGGYKALTFIPTGTFPTDGFCFWQVPKGKTQADFQAFIDGWAPGKATQNILLKIDSTQSMGVSGFNHQNWDRHLMDILKAMPSNDVSMEDKVLEANTPMEQVA